jgi:hypothetical protein
MWLQRGGVGILARVVVISGGSRCAEYRREHMCSKAWRICIAKSRNMNISMFYNI